MFVESANAYHVQSPTTDMTANRIHDTRLRLGQQDRSTNVHLISDTSTILKLLRYPTSASQNIVHSIMNHRPPWPESSFVAISQMAFQNCWSQAVLDQVYVIGVLGIWDTRIVPPVNRPKVNHILASGVISLAWTTRKILRSTEYLTDSRRMEEEPVASMLKLQHGSPLTPCHTRPFPRRGLLSWSCTRAFPFMHLPILLQHSGDCTFCFVPHFCSFWSAALHSFAHSIVHSFRILFFIQFEARQVLKDPHL